MQLGCLGAEGEATAARILDRPIQPQVRHQPHKQQESHFPRVGNGLCFFFFILKNFFKKRFILLLLSYTCVHVCVRALRSMLDLLELNLQTVVTCPMWVLGLNLGPLQEQYMSLNPELLLQTLFYYF